MSVCDDLRLGGILTTGGITGGTTINGTRFAVDDWTGMFGHAGISFSPVEISGRPGGRVVGDGLPLIRYPTVNLRIKNRLECDSMEEPEEVLQENTDEFLAMLADPGGQYLEVDLPDGTTRFLAVMALTPALIAQPANVRRINVNFYSDDWYWRAGGNQSTDTINGADTLTTSGNVSVYDAVMVFAGDGTFSNPTLGWTLEVEGSTGAVTIDLGNRSVMMGGNDADQVIRPSDRRWGWFAPGINSVSSDVSVTVTWRDAYN